ncbi:MAG: hypothetical protein ABIO58_02860 [Luteimonas sp.]
MNNALKVAALALVCLTPSTTHAGGLVQLEFKLANFSAPLAIDNSLLPLTAGRHIVYYEVEGDQCVVNDFVVTRSTKHDFRGKYAGLTARVVSDKAWLDKACNGGRDLLLENTVDWHAQDNAGNVWYLGEDTTEYFYDDAGHPLGTSKEGSWEAGRGGAEAGLVMLARPAPGLFYQQEFAPGVAEDAAKVQKVGVAVSIGLGDFTGCLVTKETTALSPGSIEYKSYCPEVGLVLVEVSGNKGGAEAVDLGLD